LVELIADGRKLASRELADNAYTHMPAQAALLAWSSKAQNIIQIVFGAKSNQYDQFLKLTDKHHGVTAFNVNRLVGLLEGSLDDLEHGFLIDQAFIVALEVFDAVIHQAKQLNNAGYKDPAAALGLVVLEDAIKRLAINTGHADPMAKTTILNDRMHAAGVYPQPQFRLIASRLAIGASAAKGEFDAYTSDDVKNMLEDIERFLTAYFAPTP
jgi:hypothetical protein